MRQHPELRTSSVRPVSRLPVTDVSVADLLSLVPVLAAAYGVVMGAVALITGWGVLRDRPAARYRRRAVVPPVGATGPGVGGVR